MEDVEKIVLNRKEERLLRYIERNHLWMKDVRASGREFQTLDSYQMITGCIDEKFPVEYVPRTELREHNAYQAVHDVWKYWRYAKDKKKDRRRGFRWNVSLLIIGGAVTFIFERLNDIIAFIQTFFQ